MVFNENSLAILTLGFIFVIALAFYAFKKLGKGWSFKALFKEFNRKMWMTFWLGGLFFSLYLITVLLGSYIIQLWRTDFFFIVYRNPVAFIYGGLCLFAFLSLSIYLARMFIKYYYLTHGKDS